MSKKSITEVVSLIVSALEPFASEERHRAVSASLMLLGEAATQTKARAAEESKVDADGGEIPNRAQSWMKQNNLSFDQIYQIFHLADDGVEVIAASLPGKNNRERVRNAYVLCGIANLLSTGVANFDDKTARGVCEKLGIYDHTNHMKYMKGGNEFTGSKDKGWTLTAPGLKHGAGMIASMAQ
jgi:hypothetical protein